MCVTNFVHFLSVLCQLQRLLSSVPKVTVEESFNCTLYNTLYKTTNFSSSYLIEVPKKITP